MSDSRGLPDDRLTKEQRRALAAREPRVFVTAAAGSGKTSLLVSRYLLAVLEEGKTLDILPTVTFTRKAAGELRERIRAELLRRGLDDLAWSLDAAPIGTIDSLCSSLLRRHPVQAGVDPAFQVLDEDRADMLMSEVLESVWEAAVEAAGADELALLARYKQELREGLIPLYADLRRAGMREPRFRLPGTPEPQAAEDRLRAALDAALADSSVPLAGELAAANARKAAQCRDWLPTAGASWTDLEVARSFRPNLGCSKKVLPLFQEVAGALEDYSGLLGARYLLGLARLVDAILVAFHERYEARKRKIGALDYQDLGLGARELLSEGALPFGPEAVLLVDEFQDTDRIQCSIFDRLGVGSLFTVGDPYQSIYGFRGAEVEVFRERQAEIAATGGGVGVLRSLSFNFRARQAVLEPINRIFSSASLFGDCFPQLCAGRAHGTDRPAVSQTAGADMTIHDDSRTRLHPAVQLFVMLGRDLRAAGSNPHEVEAQTVATQIATLIAEGWEPRDIAVLMYSLSGVGPLEDVLQTFDIPYYVVQGRGYYQRFELSDVISLLRVIVNPRDDLALITVLRSPLVGLSDDGLYLLSKARKDRRGFLWEAAEEKLPGLPAVEAARLKRFIDQLSRLRRNAADPGLADLVERAITSFDYDLVTLSAPDGRRRFANLRKLMRLAEEFEEVSGPNLAGFVRYLGSKNELTAREGNAAILAEDENVVRIMTIHQAKGLEFPVVIVAGMGRSPRTKSPALLAARDGTCALSLPAPGGRAPSLDLGPARDILAERRGREDEERARLYYVAMTRAKERLILAGVLRDRAGDTPILQVLQALQVDPESLAADSVVQPLPDLDLLVSAIGTPAVVVDPGEHARQGRQGDFVPAARESNSARPLAPPLPPAAPSPLPPVLAAGSAAISDRVSFSALAQYARCPRAYFLDRLLGPDAPDERRQAAGGAWKGASGWQEDEWPWESESEQTGPPEVGGREVGHLVHLLLERQSFDRWPSLAELAGAVEKCARELGLTPSGEVCSRAASLANAFWDSPVSQWTGLSVASREEHFLFALDDTLVTGVVDLILRDSDEWRIVDYKTNRLEGRHPEQVAETYGLQRAIYALAGLLSGAPKVTVTFLLLEAPGRPVSTTYLPSQAEDLRDEVRGAMRRLQNGDYAAEPLEAAVCEYCPHHDLCR